MKSLISLAGIGFLVLTAGETWAQEASLSINVESDGTASEAQRTPAMIVQEIAIPVLKSASDSARATAQSTRKGTGKGAAASTAAPRSPQGSVAQSPIFISGTATTTASHEMSTTGNPKYDQLIAQAAARHGVDPNLIVAVMRQESGFNPRARSYKGATGLMQLMPGTAYRFGVNNIYDPAQNIEGGTAYLRFLIDKFNGDVDLVLAGYNAGEGAVVNSGYRVPRYRETQNYVKSISARYNRVRNQTARTPSIGAAPVAPTAELFSNGRLSNNY
ncbi:MAG TPA: lytic transglycosylase domain-containing protein [Blastocatellia bacterium]|nr:lytic transglycosylase domain-containing protein [Blastocatellia bacterium]